MNVLKLYVTVYILAQLACLTELTRASHQISDGLTRNRQPGLIDSMELYHKENHQNLFYNREKRDIIPENSNNKEKSNANNIETSTEQSKVSNNKKNSKVNNENDHQMSNEIPLTNDDLGENRDLTDEKTSCPLSCQCGTVFSRLSKRALYSLECSGLQLKKLPDGIPQGIQLLKLPSNRIDLKLLGSLRQLSKLSEVHLEANHIYTVQNWELLSTTLHYLLVDSNEIDYLANSTFIGVPNLLYFSGSHNKIEVIHRNAFAGLSKLEVLILTANRISEIDVHCFRNLFSLKELHLGGNNIHTLNDGSFEYLSNLQTLDLSGNHLHTIHSKAFVGLKKLKQLYLQENGIHMLPNRLFQVFSLCDIIDLSRNYMKSINSYTFVNVNVSNLMINAMHGLQLIDIHSFVNLPYLYHLEMIANRDLIYIDRGAFLDLPKLDTLSIANNALNVVEKPILQSLPSLKQIDFHSNPLFCDCAMIWVRDKVDLQARNISILNTNKTKCHLPQEMAGLSISHPKIQSIPQTCSPRILPLFQAQYNISLGEPFKISCKATSVPVPTVTWYLPSNHKRKLDKQIVRGGERKSNVRHGEQLPIDQLIIDFTERSDGGNYTCTAQNTIGISSAYTKINIVMSSAYLIISKLTSTSVTITWARTHHSRDYEVVYHRDILQNFTYHTVKIEPYMREYTVSGLLPSTKYKFCIAVRFSDKHIPINCSSVITRNINYMSSALHSSKNFVISGAISILICIVILICVVGYFSRRYNKKKERESKLFTDSLSQLYPASLDSISDTTPITYENRIAEMFDLDDGDMPSTSQRTTSLSSNSMA